jgi:hypothetical protein
VDVVLAYLDWLSIPRDQEGGIDLGEGYETVLAQARELAPDDQRIVRIERRVEEWRQTMAGSGSEEPTAAPGAAPLLPASGGASPGPLVLLGLAATAWLWLWQRWRERR